MHGIVVVERPELPALGLELYRHLVACANGIPTVIITAHPEALTKRARPAGITCYLTKPFTPDELLECVREAAALYQGLKRLLGVPVGECHCAVKVYLVAMARRSGRANFAP